MIAIVVWTLLLALTAATLVLAVIATRPGRHRLVLPSLVPVAVAAILGYSGAWPPAPSPALPLLMGLGLAALGVIGGSAAVTLLLQLATRGSVTLGAHGGILVRDAGSPPPARREILRGGTVIGYLERFALIGAVLVGQAGAVAIIVAVKGLGRFSELENEQARERFIIGTLASLVWAGVVTAAISVLPR